jgi:hypothetical protein
VTIYDDTAAKLLDAVPKSIRWGQLVPVSQVGYVVNDAGDQQTLTVWVDLGSGPVQAVMSQTFLTYLLGLANINSAVGALVIVEMTPSPTVIDLVGSKKLAYP